MFLHFWEHDWQSADATARLIEFKLQNVFDLYAVYAVV